MSLIKSIFSTLGAVSLSLLLAGNLLAADYQHSLKVDKMTFDWSIEEERLAIRLSAPTNGWVGIGFHPTHEMKDANIFLGFVKDGKVELSNEFGIEETRHIPQSKNGGTNNVTLIGGTETGNTTTLEFAIPLKSGDGNTRAIDPASDTVVILAYGPAMDSFKVRHQFAKTITVNLGSGSMK